MLVENAMAADYGYALLEKPHRLRAGRYSIRPIQPGDMHPIRRWRNAQIEILRQQKLITAAEQDRYWIKQIRPEFDRPQPRQILTILLCDDERVGYGGLTGIDWMARRAEISFLADTDRSLDRKDYVRDFEAFLVLIVTFAFERLRLHRAWTETFDIRPHHVKVLEKFGFVLEGRLRDHVVVNGEYADSLIHGYLGR